MALPYYLKPPIPLKYFSARHLRVKSKETQCLDLHIGVISHLTKAEKEVTRQWRVVLLGHFYEFFCIHLWIIIASLAQHGKEYQRP